MDILKLFSINQASFHWHEIVLSLVITTLLSLLVSGVYMLTHKERGYDQDLIQTFIFISVVISAVMLVIGNNVVGAFGLVGAVSIIRFRTRLENPQDTAFIFFEMAIGLSCGLKQYSVAMLATFFICAMLILFWKFNYAHSDKQQNGNILSVRMSNIVTGRNIIEAAFENKVMSWDILGVHGLDDKKAIVDYKIALKSGISSKSFVDELYALVQNELVILRYEAMQV